MWYNNRLYRLLVVGAIYLLGALAASILRVREGQSRLVNSLMGQLFDVLTTWALAAPFLPFGSTYYLDGYWGWVVGGLAVVVLSGLLIWILATSSRVGLILGYSVFIILVVVLARGCAYARIP